MYLVNTWLLNMRLISSFAIVMSEIVLLAKKDLLNVLPLVGRGYTHTITKCLVLEVGYKLMRPDSRLKGGQSPKAISSNAPAS